MTAVPRRWEASRVQGEELVPRASSVAAQQGRSLVSGARSAAAVIWRRGAGGSAPAHRCPLALAPIRTGPRPLHKLAFQQSTSGNS